MRGRQITARPRPPKTIEGVRYCSDAECETVLSRYNKRTTCYQHTPTRFPRNRGRKRRSED